MKSVRIGGRIRRMRQERRLSQVQMAEELGISASYLNLIESNQRPVTVRVLLRLAERFQVDMSALSVDEDERLVSALMEAFSDPMFDAKDVKASDIKELVASLPAVGRAVSHLYTAWRRGSGGAPQPGTQSDSQADAPATTLPSEEVSDLVQQKLNHFEELEHAADALWRKHGLGLHSLYQDLVAVLAKTYAVNVDVLPAASMQGMLRDYNPMTRRLMLSEMLPLSSRTFQLAHQIGLLGHRREIDRAVSLGKLTSDEADALARTALANYFAGAVMMPYELFLNAARQTRYDIATLEARFGASFEQVCHRLTTLRRQGAEGVPFHLIRVDVAGNISKRFSASGIHIARFGAACPRWNVYDAFSTPGLLRVQVSRMPDGDAFLCVAQTVRPPGRAQPHGPMLRRGGLLAIGLGCSIAYAKDLVYSDGIDLNDANIVTPIGVSCRLCPREDCTDRAMPAFHQKISIDENRRGISAYRVME